MNWRDTRVAPSGTHHLLGEDPLYHKRFDSVLKYHSPGLAPVQRALDAWHIDLRGEDAYTRRFSRTFGFYEGRAAVVSPDGWHHVHPEGDDLSPRRFAWCGNYQGGRCAVRASSGAYFHLDVAGAPAYSARWRYAGDYRDGVAVVQRDDGLSTHVDLQGEPLHGRGFLDLDVFHKGFARARDGAGWTHINAAGDPVYSSRFAMVEPFYNGQARVETTEGALWIIDEGGAQVAELRGPRVDALQGLSADLVGYWRTQGIGTAVALGLFEALPGSVNAIAQAIDLPAQSALRLLRGMASLSLVEQRVGLWIATARGALLRRDHPLTLADAALEYAGPLTDAWRTLPAALRHPRPTGIFQGIAEDESRRRSHHRMLGSYALNDYRPWISTLPIHSGDRVLDAGGGSGSLACLLHERFPDSAIRVGDLPAVAQEVTGVESVGMDLFAPWPIQADLILLARVLHDWPDAEARSILTRARDALAPGGRLLVLEGMHGEDDVSAALCDLHLLAVTGGQERSRGAWEVLFMEAGLRLERIESRSDSIVSLLVVVPQGEFINPEDRALGDLRASLERIPTDRPVALLLRHGDRASLGPTELVDDIPLTADGVRRTTFAGALLEGRLRRIHSSPLDRCVQTAVALREGARAPCPIELSTLLGAPGCFVSQEDSAGESFFTQGLDAVFLTQLTSLRPPPGFRETAEGVRRLLAVMMAPGQEAGVHGWITHDSILGIVLGHLLGWQGLGAFPGYLEGAWFWAEGEDLHLLYRRASHRLSRGRATGEKHTRWQGPS